MHCMPAVFGVVSSSRFPFPFRARTDRQKHKFADATEHPTQSSATAGVGDKETVDIRLGPGSDATTPPPVSHEFRVDVL